MTAPPCSLCGDPSTERFGNGHLCASCIPDGDDSGQLESDDTEPDAAPGDRAVEAFAVAIDYFTDQLDRDISEHTGEDGPDTPREYYQDVRGWSPTTIDDKRLGYAPEGARELRDHLMSRGFDVDDLLATGLFYPDDSKGVHPHFRGRYVLPYFDGEGRPVYAISRSLDEDNGGHAADHHGEQKYTKAVKGKDYSQVDEPIYGAETVDDDTDRLLVAGGIADAITLHEAGYACISPVTTVRFKERHEPEVADIVDHHGIEGVYIVNDAERPTADVTELDDGETADRITDVLTITQDGEGRRGAFGNVEFLVDAGVTPYLVDLPAGDGCLRKLDPDDYVKEDWGSVETLLTSAKPATQNPRYRKWKRRRRQRATEEARQSTGEGSGALFDLTFEDVAGLKAGFRGDNPLGHHGDSHDYFTVFEKGGTTYGYDHKYNEAYNGLTYLLCLADERRADDPNGRLDDGEVFAAWRYAKANRLIPDDEPIPYRALRHVALNDGGLSKSDLVEREGEDGGTYTGFPDADAYNDALAHVREEYGVEPGRDPVDGGCGKGEPVAALPIERLQALDPDEARRYARRRGVEWPTTREARKRLRDRIMQAMRAGETTVLDAPTALGKSHTVATEPWLRRASITDEKPVVHFHETREARDQAAEASSNSAATHACLLGRREACDVAAGVHDPDDEDAPEQVITIHGQPASQWLDAVCEGRGVPFSVAHTYLAENNDQDVELPCSVDVEGNPMDCQAFAQWNGLPRDEDTGEPTVDVIHATHQFAYVPSLRRHAHVVFDERPTFTTELSTDRVQRIVVAYLKAVDAPATTWERFVNLATFDPGYYDDVAKQVADERDRLRDVLGVDPGREWYLEADDAHTLAPALAKAIFYALAGEADANGRRAATVPHKPPRLDQGAHDDDGWNRTWVSVVLDEDNRIRTVRDAPDLTLAASVVGLDAHPSAPLWQRNVHPNITVDRVLDPEERRLWRLFERGLTVVQVGDATRPLSSGRYFDEGGTTAMIDALRSAYDSKFRTCITASAVENQTLDLMREAGIDDAETMHYGEEKSRNDFGDETVGFVNGCIDPGDDYVLDLLAECGLDATPETVDVDGETKRARGRGFEGDDAGTAGGILASVRENHVAQAAGRYARDADDDTDRATVFVRTDALPPGYADLLVPGVEWVATEAQARIIDELGDRPSATARELAEAADVTKEHVRKTLRRLVDTGTVEYRERAGDNGGDVYRALAGEVNGVVDLGDVQIANDAVLDSCTWSLAISPAEYSPDGSNGGETGRGYTREDMAPGSQTGLTDYSPG